jgi:hypothetical protein
MRAWMQQRGQLQIVSAGEVGRDDGYTNPYTFSAGSLTLMLANVVEAVYDFTNDTSNVVDPVHAEIERLRLYNEVMLYTARLCESMVKQLLYCTVVPEKRYEKKALGELLESPCPQCRKENGKTPHMVSLVASLAHPFGLCLEFEHCAMDHMAWLNKLRNAQAAHSGVQTLNVRTVMESKRQLDADHRQVIEGFLHMLSHLEKLESLTLHDLAEKGEQIELLRLNGLPPDQANFRLIPGEPMEHE